MSAISVVIPTYNALPLLKKHLPEVLAALRPGDELIIVDDAGTDDSSTWIRNEFAKTHDKAIGIRVIVNETNSRFGASCNHGVEQANSEIVVLLNNDVSPQKDFLKFLLPHFEDPKVFAVGCKEISGENNEVESGRAEAHFERGFYVHSRAKSQTTGETAWVAGGSGAFRKSMWQILGGFDLRFKPAYGEDIDLSYRAQLKGWKTLFEARSIVHHVHESTNASVFGQKQIEIMSYKNALIFMWNNTRGIKLVSHFLWLPYHLVFTSWRSRGRFLSGLWLAASSR